MSEPDNNQNIGACINLDQLRVVVATADQWFDLLRIKYPELYRQPGPANKAYLVLSLPSGQTEIYRSPTEILTYFPTLIRDEEAKASALALLSRLNTFNSEGTTVAETERLTKEKELLRNQLNQVATQLRYDAKCQIELRFYNLEFDLIWELQRDAFVDRNLTPQSKASIRIVLGTLAHLLAENK